MPGIASFLFFLAAFGCAALSVRYLSGPVPTRAHREMLDGERLSAPVLALLRHLYILLGSLLFVLSVAIVVLTYYAALTDAFWAKLALVAMALIGGLGGAQAAQVFDRATGATPRQMANALTVLGVMGFVGAVI